MKTKVAKMAPIKKNVAVVASKLKQKPKSTVSVKKVGGKIAAKKSDANKKSVKEKPKSDNKKSSGTKAGTKKPGNSKAASSKAETKPAKAEVKPKPSDLKRKKLSSDDEASSKATPVKKRSTKPAEENKSGISASGKVDKKSEAGKKETAAI